MYCTIEDVKAIIAQALTSAENPNSGQIKNLVNIGKNFDKNTISNDTVEYYIKLASREIDSSLSELYETPICKRINFESSLSVPIDEYNDVLIIERACPLQPGDIVAIKSADNYGEYQIEDIDEYGGFILDGINDSSFAEGSRVMRLDYPDPIHNIAVRLAAANIYDKYFASQVSPNTSEYGQYLRDYARKEINNILTGIVILHGQTRIGRRFYNPNLDDRYGISDLSGSERTIGELR